MASVASKSAMRPPGNTAPELMLSQANTSSSAASRKLVRNAWLELEVGGEDERRHINSEARKIARALGGYLATEGSLGFTVRVPADQVEVATKRLGALAELVDQGFSVEEVTAKYVDLVVRLENAKRLKRRLQSLLDRATKVEEVLSVEKELARVTENLERLEGQLRVLKKQVALATIEVRFKDDVSPGPLGWVFYGIYRGVKWLFVWD